MSAVQRVLIVGGGPAGLSAATVLNKRGIVAELAEINDEIRPLGSGVTMSGSTLRALDMVDEDLLERCLRAGASYTVMAYCNAKGEVMRRVERPQPVDSRYPNGFGIMRPILWGLLAEAARDAGTRIRLSTTVAAIEQDEDAVEVTFNDGSRETYDLVVGADGVHSQIRRMVFRNAPEPAFTDQVAWRAVVPRPPDSGSEIAMYYSPHSKAGFNFVSDTHMYVFANENIPQTEHAPRERWLDLLREMLAEYEGVIGWAREQMTDPDLVDRRALHYLLVPPPWYRGRVLLIGDAVHATTPQLAAGAGMAIEDAVVLGDVLDRHGDLDHALSEFMERRYERCRLVVENSRQIGEWEKRPGDPDADPAGLAIETYASLATPF